MATSTESHSTTRRTRASNKAAASKADAARTIFNRLHGKKPRKEVIEAFVNEAKLTPSGASTYYQRFTNAGGHMQGRKGKASTRGAQVSSRPRGRPIDEDSKAGIARAIFKRLHGKKPRKEVIEAFQKEAGLTPAGSSTYYQKMKSAA